MTSSRCAALALTTLLGSCAPANAQPPAHPSFAGTWTLVAADKESRDGTRVHEYGEHPKGRLMIDEKGRYSLQIFRPDLPNFAANESDPTPEEYHDAMEAASTHYGEISVDWAKHILRIAIDGALYPNLRGSVQMRSFEFDGEVLSYRIPPSPEGIVRISVWRRDK
jgi:lipocalin-like protein